jgi:drug/metabolite transporter (DMT)-like permease
MVVLLGLTAALLYGSGDFLGGLATRRAHVLTVLALVETAGVIVALAAAVMWPGRASLAGLAWGVSAGLIGGLGLIVFYTGLAAGPMSVVAPVSGLVSTVLPVAVALAEGERPGTGVYAGALLCLVAIVLASSAGGDARGDAVGGGKRGDAGSGAGLMRLPGRLGRAIGYGTASGVSFGLFFLLIRNAGQSGPVWSVAAGRIGELAIVLAAAAVLGPGLLRGTGLLRDTGLLRGSGLLGGAGGSVRLAAVAAGAIDVLANVCYVAATRTGMFGLAVVLASMYPGVTVLLARVVLGERLRWVQRAGLGLAAVGILLVAA